MARGFQLDRACITGAWDDGSEDVTAVIRSGGYVGTLKITPENRAAVISEGWRSFANLPAEAFDIQPPHGDYTPNGLNLDFWPCSITLEEKSKTYPFAVYIRATLRQD